MGHILVFCFCENEALKDYSVDWGSHPVKELLCFLSIWMEIKIDDGGGNDNDDNGWIDK